ncbi:MAG: hypothetical protein AB8H86_11145 [Polyangiales bacterium]
MTHPLPRSPRNLADADLVADLQRDLGADTLFFICVIEAAIGVQTDAEIGEGNSERVEIAQLDMGCLDEAA